VEKQLQVLERNIYL